MRVRADTGPTTHVDRYSCQSLVSRPRPPHGFAPHELRQSTRVALRHPTPTSLCSRPQKRAGGKLRARDGGDCIDERGDKTVDGGAAFRQGWSRNLEDAGPKLSSSWSRERGERDQLQRRADLGLAPRRQQAERVGQAGVEGLGPTAQGPRREGCSSEVFPEVRPIVG